MFMKVKVAMQISKVKENYFNNERYFFRNQTKKPYFHLFIFR